MAEPCKCYLIDPVEQTITEVMWNGDYHHINELLGIDSPFDVVRLSDDGDCIYVDDEGLFKPDQRFFKLATYHQPLAGRGLVTGTDEEGETVEPKISLSEVKGLISWVRPDLKLAGFDNIPDGTIADTPFGPMPVIGSTPVFKTGKDDDDGDE